MNNNSFRNNSRDEHENNFKLKSGFSQYLENYFIKNIKNCRKEVTEKLNNIDQTEYNFVFTELLNIKKWVRSLKNNSSGGMG